MRTFTALLSIALTAAFTLNAAAQEVQGQWRVETVSNESPPEGASLTLSFGEENKATVTYLLGGESQSWHYTYGVAEGQLTLEPAKSFGEPQTVTYDIRFDEGKLLLLTPMPEPAEEEADGAGGESGAEADGAEGSEAAGSEDAEEAEDAEKTEDAEEEDFRVPVWVLVKA